MMHRNDAMRALNSLRDLKLGGSTCKVAYMMYNYMCYFISYVRERSVKTEGLGQTHHMRGR